jgi:hypothetical protein
MKTWMKVAIGCIAAAVIACFLFVAGLLGFGYWAKNQIEQATSGGPEVEEARRKANAVPFSMPTGGVIAEEQLVKFIEIRANVYSVYQKYRGEIDARAEKIKEGKGIDFSDISTSLTFVSELQKAEALALAKHGMSEDEYGFISGEVYKSMWTDMSADAGGRKGMKNAADATKTASEVLKEKAGELPPEARAGLEKASEELARSSEDVRRELEGMGTSPENAALFRKYEKDLKKYAMPGLGVLFDEKGEPLPPGKPRT